MFPANIINVIATISAISAATLVAPIIALLLFFAYYDIYNRILLPTIHASSPKISHFLLGNVDFASDYLTFQRKLRDIYGTVVKFRILHMVQVMITEPEDAKSILSSANFRKGTPYDQIRNFWGSNNLLVLENSGPHANWKPQRTLLNQAFRASAIRNLQGIFDRNAQEMADRLESMVDQEVDFLSEIRTLNINIICDVIGARSAPKEFTESMLATSREMSSPFTIPLLVLPFGGLILRHFFHRKYLKIINGFIYQAIHEKIAERRNRKVKDKNENEIEELTMLELLVDAEDEETGQRLTPDEIRDHLFMFLLAGQDTTSNTISWLVYNMATHPLAEQALFAELDSTSIPAPPEQLRKLTYMHNCFNETLRLYPPACSLTREVIEPYTLATHPDVKIPPYVQATVFIFGLQRDERYWNHPERFDPSRWDSGDEPKERYAYMPFSAGPRICIGKNFFFASATTIAAILFKRYRFELSPGVKDNGRMAFDNLLKPHTLKVIVRRR